MDAIKKFSHQFIHRILEDPVYCARLATALLRGTYLIVKYKVIARNVIIKFPFKAFANITIVGPGSVTIERNCSVDMSVFKGLTIVTLSPEASVFIGSDCSLQGLTIRCRRKIIIKDKCMTALSLVQDAHFVCCDQIEDDLGNSGMSGEQSIYIGRNVWLGGGSCTLNGCRIGSNSVLAAGALCYNFEAKDSSLIIGSPSRRALPIKKILNMNVKND